MNLRRVVGTGFIAIFLVSVSLFVNFASPPIPPSTSPSHCPATLKLVTDFGKLDLGWTGSAHSLPLGKNVITNYRVNCRTQADGACGYCDLAGPISDPTLTSVEDSNSTQRCTLDTSIKCSTSKPCPLDKGECRLFIGGPMPVKAAGDETKRCLVNYYDETHKGFFDLKSGQGVLNTFSINSKVYDLSGSTEKPCPICKKSSATNQNICLGGARDGLPCTTNTFFKTDQDSLEETSLDCPPSESQYTRINVPSDLGPFGTNLADTNGVFERKYVIKKEITPQSPRCMISLGRKCLVSGQTAPNSCIDDNGGVPRCVPDSGDTEKINGHCDYPRVSCFLDQGLPVNPLLPENEQGYPVKVKTSAGILPNDGSADMSIGTVFRSGKTEASAVDTVVGLPGPSRINQKVKATLFKADGSLYRLDRLFNPTLYVATQGGLSISKDLGNTFLTKTTSNGLASNVVYDSYGNGSGIYAATSDGLSFSSDGGATFTTEPTGLGVAASSVKAITANSEGIYLATLSGLIISTDGGATYTTRTTANGLPSNSTYGVAVNGATIYVATHQGLSISTDGGDSFVTKTKSNGLGENTINSVFLYGSKVYVGTGAGISISSDGGNTFFNKVLGSSSAMNVSSVFVNDSGIYAGTGYGLFVSRDGGVSYTRKLTTDGLGSSNVLDVVASNSGTEVFVATQLGLSVSTNRGVSFVNKTTSDGLANIKIHKVYYSGDDVSDASNIIAPISTPSATVTTTPTPTPTPSPTPIPICAPAPVSGCTEISKAAVQMKLPVAKDPSLKLKIVFPSFTDVSTAFGNPTDSRFGVKLCYYVNGSLKYSRAAKSGTCSSKKGPMSCWSNSKGKYVYQNMSSDTGISSVILTGKDISISGAGQGLKDGIPALPLSGPLTVQVSSPSTNKCWNSRFDASTSDKVDSLKLKISR